MTVWVLRVYLSEENYIVGVYSTEALAEAAAAKFRTGPHDVYVRITELVLDQAADGWDL